MGGGVSREVKLENERIRKEKKSLENKYEEIKEELRKEQERKRMDEMARKIQDEARERVDKEVYLRRQAEENLEKGIPAVKYHSGEDMAAVRIKHEYQEGNLHFAITGVSGSGKSSLINAFRGYKNNHKQAAKCGTIETTQQITRYIDPVQEYIRWYDVPGAGTLKVPDWQYFNDQGLYIFDIIIIAIDIRFTKIDVALLLNCKRFNIPTFVVRSKANQHIYNTMSDDYDNYEDSGEANYNDGSSKGGVISDNNLQIRYEQARDKFVSGTCREFDSILESVGLPKQKIYIVSKDALCSFIQGSEPPSDIIDEMELMRDIYSAVNERRRKKEDA